MLVTKLVHLHHLLLALFKATEVVLYEERRVELAHRDVIVSYNVTVINELVTEADDRTEM